MTYDAVIFDFDGTLVEGPQENRLREAVCRACRGAGIETGVDDVARALRTGDIQAIAERCRTAGVSVECLRTRMAVAVVRAQIRAIKTGIRSVYDGVTTVESMNTPTGIVSDNHPAVVAFLLDWFDIADQFDVVRGCRFTRDGLDRRKPSAGNLTAATTALGTASALYVGDSQVDIEAAENAGLDSAVIDRDGTQPDSATPTYTLSSLSELSVVLGNSS